MFYFVLSTPDDEHAFLSIYETHKGLIYSVSWNILRNQQSAEDNTQDVLLYIIDNFPRFATLNEKQVKGLIALISSSIAKNNLRYNSRHNVNAISYDSETMPEIVDDSAFDACDAIALASVIDSLTDDYKLPLYYQYVYGYNSKEIAQILNISDSLVRKRIQLAKKQLLTMLEE